MSRRLLICTDLDRTLLPNGEQPESPRARERFAAIAARPEVGLAYVTGRHRTLVEDAIEAFGLPQPDYVIGDVGTTIYRIRPNGEWEPWEDWFEAIAPDWDGLDRQQIEDIIGDIDKLRLQEPPKQNRFKISYYAPAETEAARVIEEASRRLDAHRARCNLIWSLDETVPVGLLDVLPASASKLHAIEFLIRREGFAPEETVFAGDSGNDLQVLCSPIPSVLVANAAPEVKLEATALAERNGTRDALYLAQGGFLGMNGNYSAGILEGIAHFNRGTLSWWS